MTPQTNSLIIENMKILSAALVAIAGLSAMVDCRDDGIRGALKIGQEGGGHSSVNPNVKLSSDGDQVSSFHLFF